MTSRPVERPGINGQPKSSPEQLLQYVVKQNTHAVKQAQGRTPAGRAGVLLRHPCFNASQITVRLPGLSHYDKPPGPLATHHLHNNTASSPCRRGSTINIHHGLKNNNKNNNNCRGLLTALLLTSTNFARCFTVSLSLAPASADEAEEIIDIRIRPNRFYWWNICPRTAEVKSSIAKYFLTCGVAADARFPRSHRFRADMEQKRERRFES